MLFGGSLSIFARRVRICPAIDSIYALTLKSRLLYAGALRLDTGATFDDLREAVTILEDAERIARRVLGGAHPLTAAIEDELQKALRARETLSA